MREHARASYVMDCMKFVESFVSAMMPRVVDWRKRSKSAKSSLMMKPPESTETFARNNEVRRIGMPRKELTKKSG